MNGLYSTGPDRWCSPEDPLSRGHDLYRGVTAGIHITTRRAGCPSAVASDPLPWCARPEATLRPDIVPNVPVNANTPSADHAEGLPPAAPAPMSLARLLTKPPGAVLNGERWPEGRKPGRAFVNERSRSTSSSAPVRWHLEDRRRHRTSPSPRDRQDPHPSRFARPSTAPSRGQGLRSIRTGLIPHRSPLPSGSAPEPTVPLGPRSPETPKRSET